MKTILYFAQIAVSLLLIVLILLQQRGGGGFGPIFGQESGFYSKLRGLHRKIFIFTIFVAGLFILLSVLNLII